MTYQTASQVSTAINSALNSYSTTLVNNTLYYPLYSKLTVPANNQIGYQTIISSSDNFTYTTSGNFNWNGWNFVITPANYGTYIMEFQVDIKINSTATYWYSVGLTFSNVGITNPETVNSSKQIIPASFSGYITTLKFIGTFALYSPQTVYCMFQTNNDNIGDITVTTVPPLKNSKFVITRLCSNVYLHCIYKWK